MQTIKRPKEHTAQSAAESHVATSAERRLTVEGSECGRDVSAGITFRLLAFPPRAGCPPTASRRSVAAAARIDDGVHRVLVPTGDHAVTSTEINQPFRPRARLLQLLGDELIGSSRLAVFELVKNAYDADANTVTVRLDPPNRQQTLPLLWLTTARE